MGRILRTTSLVVTLLLLSTANLGCLVRIPTQDEQWYAFPDGTYDVSIGGPGAAVNNLTQHITSLCSLPTKDDFITACMNHKGLWEWTRPFLYVDHVWVEECTSEFDLTLFEWNAPLSYRMIGPSGVVMEGSTYLNPHFANAIGMWPTTPPDLLALDWIEGDCFDVEFTLSGENPNVNVPIKTSLKVNVELRFAGIFDLLGFSQP